MNTVENTEFKEWLELIITKYQDQYITWNGDPSTYAAIVGALSAYKEVYRKYNEFTSTK